MTLSDVSFAHPLDPLDAAEFDQVRQVLTEVRRPEAPDGVGAGWRYASIELTRRALAKADERGGKRGPWLRALDRIGAGFDS